MKKLISLALAALLAAAPVLAQGRLPAPALRAGTIIPEYRVATNYGMVCDNVTDDGPALQSAMNASTGYRLLLPPNATCRIKSLVSIPSNTYLLGQNTTIQFDAAATGGANWGDGGNTMQMDGVSNIVIDGVIFNGPGATIASGSTPRFRGRNITNVLINNSTFQNFGDVTNSTTRANTYAQGLAIFGPNHVTVQNSIFSNNVGDGLAFSNNIQNVRIINNKTTNNWDSGIVPCTIGGNDVVAFGNTVTAPSTNVAPPIVLDRCTHAVVESNIVNSPAGSQCIRVARYADTVEINEDIKFIGNTCIGGGYISMEALGPTQGTQTVAKGGKFSVMNNTIIGSGGKGILITDSQNGIITGNRIINAAEEGIAEESFAVAVGSNIIKDNIVDGATYCLRQLNAGGSVLETNYSGNIAKNCSVTPYSFLANSGSDGPDVTFTPTVGGPIGTATYTINTSRWKRLNDKHYRVSYTFNVTALGTATSGTYTFTLPNSSTSAGDTACAFWNKTDATTANLSAGYINSGDTVAKLVIATIGTKTYELTCIYDAT